MEHYQGYYNQLAAALVRGKIADKYKKAEIFVKQLEDLLPEEINEVIRIGLQEEVDLDLLRKKIDTPQMLHIMGVLKGILPDNMLDFGRGDGTFAWRLLESFRFLPLTVIDIQNRYNLHVNDIHRGGVTNIRSILHSPNMLEDELLKEQFDVTTALDVLQKVENPFVILDKIFKVTKRFIIISFPSKKGANDLHVIDEKELRKKFQENDILQIKVDKIRDTIIMVARK